MKNEDVLARIKQLQTDENQLGGYLMEVAKNDPNAVKYISEYEKLLERDSWYLRKVGIFALLFCFKLNDERYTDKAVSFLKDSDEDDEVRRWSAAGLSTIYHATQDPEIMKLLFGIMENRNESRFIRISCLTAMLYVMGLDAVTVAARSSGAVSVDAHLKEFKDEIDKTRKIIE